MRLSSIQLHFLLTWPLVLSTHKCASAKSPLRGLIVEPSDEIVSVDAEAVHKTRKLSVDNGGNCGICLRLISSNECPSPLPTRRCTADDVDIGELCTAVEDECGTDSGANNCDVYDVYERVPCGGENDDDAFYAVWVKYSISEYIEYGEPDDSGYWSEYNTDHGETEYPFYLKVGHETSSWKRVGNIELEGVSQGQASLNFFDISSFCGGVDIAVNATVDSGLWGSKTSSWSVDTDFSFPSRTCRVQAFAKVSVDSNRSAGFCTGPWDQDIQCPTSSYREKRCSAGAVRDILLDLCSDVQSQCSSSGQCTSTGCACSQNHLLSYCYADPEACAGQNFVGCYYSCFNIPFKGECELEEDCQWESAYS